MAEDVTSVYHGPTAIIGHHRYPAAWAKVLADFPGVNEYHMDGILQKLALPWDYSADGIVTRVNLYLDNWDYDYLDGPAPIDAEDIP